MIFLADFVLGWIILVFILNKIWPLAEVKGISHETFLSITFFFFGLAFIMMALVAVYSGFELLFHLCIVALGACVCTISIIVLVKMLERG
ncbi:hypothetical protein P8874_18035 [Bacillus licheniformis]|uniref:hypothetical protein n=1 Tax=Bacillus TaxID=1386 RepID=UPI00227ECDED|nr:MULTISPECIES: hypothetical protein [Bacillus]MCY8543976.1 hypothetical protein [Bacillus haynesii]MEC0718008.1 hypothetical protein [Bacillus licheniformis]